MAFCNTYLFIYVTKSMRIVVSTRRYNYTDSGFQVVSLGQSSFKM